MSEGRNSSVMTPPVVIMPRIQSMMVVTSPIGEKRAAGIGCYDNHASVDHAVVMVVDELA